MRLLISITVAVLAFFPSRASACSITDASASGFGTTGRIESQLDRIVIASVNVSCEGPYRLGLDGGMWVADTRRMTDGFGNFVGYRLWQDSASRQEWGDQGLSTSTYPGRTLNTRGRGSSTLHPVYGSLATFGSPPAGEYRDVVLVTLFYPPYGPDDHETVSVPITLRITGSCSIDASGVHGFGNWPTDGSDPKGVPLGTVSVVCPTGVYFAVGMDSGLHYDGRLRRMSDGDRFVPYILRAGSATGTEWGDTGLAAFDAGYVETYPAEPVYDRGTASVRAYSVWGDAETNGAPPGNYKDTVNVTVVW